VSEKENGREVRKLTWPDKPTRQYPTSLLCRAFFINEFHGDRDEEWIVERDNQGKEVGRHNVRFIETIWWKEEDN
jgi:hypothetical protein